MAFRSSAQDQFSATRRRLLTGVGAGAVASALAQVPIANAARPDVVLVDHGKARAAVVVQAAASNEVREAATQLAHYIGQATSTTIPLVEYPTQSPPGHLVHIYVGFAGPRVPRHAARVVDLVRHDGFCIIPGARHIAIIGSPDSHDLGTRNGVWDFLERFVGVTWLLPTEAGEDVPSLEKLAIPAETVRGEPVFRQRVFSPLSRDDGPYPELYAWARHNRLQASIGPSRADYTVAFHHNLHTLFPVEEFGKTHPEFYPGGKPPAKGVTTGWQPVFSEPGTIDVAVTKINQFFTDNPTELTFSLGANDSGGFTEIDPSESYYGWVNAVVEQVLAEHPGKWFGLLAYVQLEKPPPFPLNPQVVPFFTQDRYAWVDPAVERAATNRMVEWGQRSTQIGFYDYAYGGSYVLPRIYLERAAQTYRYARDIGVVAHYAELYPNWGEGPKPWVLARLQWDPDQDVNVLLEQWCRKAVGPAAAPYLQQFYQLWEEFWVEEVPQTDWFTPHATLQVFGDASYLEGLSAEWLATATQLMADTVRLAGPGRQGERADLLSQSFEYYRLSALTFPREQPAPGNSTEALVTLEAIREEWPERGRLATERLALVDRFDANPVLRHLLKPATFGLAWGGWNSSEFWGTVDYLRANEPTSGPVTDWLRTEASSASGEFAEFVAMVLSLADGTAENLLLNPSFEDGVGARPPNWGLWISRLGANARFSVQNGVHRSGAASVYTRAIWRGGPYQVISVRPGLLATRAWFLAVEGHEWNGTVLTGLNLRGEDGTQVGTLRGPVIPVGPHAGTWTPVDTINVIPEEINGVPITKVQLVITLDGFQNDAGFLHLDDFSVTQAP